MGDVEIAAANRARAAAIAAAAAQHPHTDPANIGPAPSMYAGLLRAWRGGYDFDGNAHGDMNEVFAKQAALARINCTPLVNAVVNADNTVSVGERQAEKQASYERGLASFNPDLLTELTNDEGVVVDWQLVLLETMTGDFPLERVRKATPLDDGSGGMLGTPFLPQGDSGALVFRAQLEKLKATFTLAEKWRQHVAEVAAHAGTPNAGASGNTAGTGEPYVGTKAG
jgi:hypothetical protein